VFNSIICRTGKEYRRKWGNLMIQKFIQQMMRFPAEFSRGITLAHVRKILNAIQILYDNSILSKNIPFLT
jgi:hypothetical protein